MDNKAREAMAIGMALTADSGYYDETIPKKYRPKDSVCRECGHKFLKEKAIDGKVRCPKCYSVQ